MPPNAKNFPGKSSYWIAKQLRQQPAKEQAADTALDGFDTLAHLPKPEKHLRKSLSGITEIVISGAGGAGGGFLGALQEAERCGLDYNKVKVVCGTSAGTIIGLGIVMGLSAKKMMKVLINMPTERFQDWSIDSIMKVFRKWGICEGKYMAEYFKQFIKDYSGLDNPTFEQLYAKYPKELRVVVNNVTTRKIETWSHITHPHTSVAEAVATSCNLPLVFPPKWFVSKNGEMNAFIDGGMMLHYPLRKGSMHTPPEQQLGLVMVNKSAAFSINEEPSFNMESFLDYIGRISTMVFYRDPLSMDELALSQTVTIGVDHNPLNFKPTKAELDTLLSQGRKALLDYVGRRTRAHRKSTSSQPLTFKYAKEREEVERVDKKRQNRPSKKKERRHAKYTTERCVGARAGT